ncbi:Uncharacterised protein [Serratia entomophila]|jgi:hypothetical protein|uniref:Uncharacterized protein n=1 Tax=Serratia entomophila TaxID=42906 RepID=A0ABY5CNK5_9GAMM|nr:hypothetical protein [Serratia entomophila]UIW16476.1 hypothetical protein KHA73_13590 [Serratia entomophila]USU99034.1 hypothetical protein KFQ06_13255 [Serratia entomophila]CAI0773077.1 Uncharacterised protein [Serratia entomophila]CAI1106444.1 Uncharacterised protein [Serratia entomophila]CAI1107039.1 Uncharacterised protein [Serratia entomophila]
MSVSKWILLIIVMLFVWLAYNNCGTGYRRYQPIELKSGIHPPSAPQHNSAPLC